MFKDAMSRRVKAFTVALYASACLALALTPTAFAGAAAATPARAKVNAVCRVSSKAAKRKLVAKATMRPIAGTTKIALEFLLEGKVTGNTPYSVLPTADLGVWKFPADVPDVWHVSQAAEGLSQGATYRFEVKFRWYGKGTTVLKNQTLYSKACVEPAGSSS